MGWDFKERSTAEKLSNFAKSMPDPPTGRMRDYKSGNVNQQILVKTPSDGIPARSEVGSNETSRDEYQMGVAECKLLTTYDPTQTGGGQRNQQTLHTVGRPYAGTNELDWRDNYTPVYVANPYPSAIAGDKIVLAHYIDGSYVVAEPPEGTRLKFVLKTSLISGEATAYILDPPPETAGDYDEVTVKDPKKLFYGAIGAEEPTRNDLSACSADLTYYAEKPGAIGWAVYSSEIGGWEIEQCTLPVQRFSAETPGGITAPSDRFSGELNEVAKSVYFNPEDSLSPYPHVDMPPEVMCNPGDENMDKELMVQALNPHRFTIIPGSKVTIERRIKEVPVSEYTGENVNPHENPEPSAGVIRSFEWVIVDAEKTIARWARCKIKPGSVTCEWQYDDADYYKEGFDPRAFFGSDVQQIPAVDVPVIPAEGLGGCECDDGSNATIPAAETIGWAFFDNNDTQYVVVTTKSAMLGKPTGTDYIQDFDINGASGCSISSDKTSGMLGWACNAAVETANVSLPTKEIEYIANIEGGCNVICPRFESATVLDCGSNTAARLSCMNIYADPCVTCTGTCYWYWDGSEWINDPSNEHDCDPNSDDCGCEGQEPPPWEIGQPVTQTTTCAVYNTPPEPTPCENCSNCSGGVGVTITSLTYNCTFPSAQYAMVPDSAVNVSDCTWRVEITWTEVGYADEPGFADITYDGTSWTVVSTPSASGEPGDFVYTSAVAGDCDGNFNLTESDPELTTSHIAGAASMGTTTTPCT